MEPNLTTFYIYINLFAFIRVKDNVYKLKRLYFVKKAEDTN